MRWSGLQYLHAPPGGVYPGFMRGASAKSDESQNRGFIMLKNCCAKKLNDKAETDRLRGRPQIPDVVYNLRPTELKPFFFFLFPFSGRVLERTSLCLGRRNESCSNSCSTCSRRRPLWKVSDDGTLLAFRRHQYQNGKGLMFLHLRLFLVFSLF